MPATRRSFTKSFTVLWLLAVVNCAFLQFQMLVFSGDIKFPGYFIKLLLILPVLANWFVAPRSRMSGSVRFFWYLAIVSLTLSFMVVYESGHLQASEQITYFLTNYLFLLLAPVCLMAAPFVDLKRLSKVLVIVAFPLILLGIAQHLLSNPIVPPASEDGSLSITAWDFFEVRAFSLFGSGLDFSFFLALMTPFFLACAVVKRHGYPGRFVSTIGLSLCLVATYATLTRAAYLVVLQSAIVGWVLSRGRSIGRMMWFAVPMIGALVAFLAIIVLPGIIAELYQDLFDNQSLVMRLLNWVSAVQTWTGNGTIAFVFGNGESQGTANVGYAVDNNFLNFAIQSGLVGLVSCVGLMCALWMSLRKVVERKPTPLWIAMCAFWSTWILSGTFGWTNPMYALMLMPLLASSEFAETTPGAVKDVRAPRYPSLPMPRPARP